MQIYVLARNIFLESGVNLSTAVAYISKVKAEEELKRLGNDWEIEDVELIE
jgi:hypothetical protein